MRPLSCIPALLLLVGCFEPANSNDTEDGSTTSTTDASSTGQSPPGSTSDDGPMATTGSATTSATSSSTTTDGADSDSSGDQPPPMSSCEGTWHPWLTSAFGDYPNGPVIGATELPSGPWSTVEGSPAIESGELTTIGDSVVVTSHGESFPFSGSRLRFSFSFEAEDNEVQVAFDADVNGNNGLSIRIRAEDGALTLLDNGTTIDSAVLGALDLGNEYLVEVEVDGGIARAWLSTEAYATVPGAEVIANLEGIANGAPAGRRLAADLSGSAGGSPRIENVVLERCDEPQPSLDDRFFDSFNRPNAEAVGFAVHPAGSEWEEYYYDEESDISGNRLRLEADHPGTRAIMPEAIGTDQTRLRAVVSIGASDNTLGLEWGISGVPTFVLPGQTPTSRLGCRIRNENGAGVVVLYDSSDFLAPAPGPFVAGTEYYVQVSLDGPAGVATVRTDSFTGPIVAATSSQSIAPQLATDNEIGATLFGTDGTFAYIDDLWLSRYPN